MEVNYDAYMRNIRMFYQQLIKGHPQEDKMTKLFKQMLQNETRKWKKGFSIRGNDRGSEGAGLLAKLKEQQKGGKQKKKVNVDLLFASSKIENMVVFGYCYLLLQYKNPEALSLLMAGANDPLSNKQMFNHMILRRVNTLYDKMDQIISGRRKIVRFQRQLMDGFKEIPQSVIDIFYKVIVQGEQLSTEDLPAYMEKISELLKIKIQYFEIDSSDSVKYFIYGTENKISMKFGQFLKDKIFGYVSRLPEKQDVQINKEVTLLKFAEVSQTLNNMYAGNLKDYMGLSNLKVGKMVRSDSVSSTSLGLETSRIRKIQSSSTDFISI